MEERALFVRDGDGYVATSLAQGGWDPRNANGGTVLALVGQCLDDVPSLVPMTMSRLTADLIRPVPLGRHLHVEPSILREGKKIQVVDVRVVIDDVDHAHVRVLRLREADVDAADLPSGAADDRPADALEPPEISRSYLGATEHDPGFLHAVEMRYARRRDGTGTGIWIRLEVPVVAGESVRAPARLAYGFDFANLIGIDVRPTKATMINPDVSAHVLRAPADEWIAITGDTRFNAALGRGLSSALLSDTRGVFAVVSMSQLLQPR